VLKTKLIKELKIQTIVITCLFFTIDELPFITGKSAESQSIKSPKTKYGNGKITN